MGTAERFLHVSEGDNRFVFRQIIREKSAVSHVKPIT
uniref:Uncharacterized protein n=1 Tax=Anguilla anguilla TaxID=7936 RepID=A0A0E9RHM9_ANGAN